MTSRDFCYWLQGHFELHPTPAKTGELDRAQVEIIKRHLSMVFEHEIDPSLGSPEHVKTLQALHDGLAKAHERIEEVAKLPRGSRRDIPLTC
jgi:hypothetical protein